MLLIIQPILYCLLFFLMVKAAVKDNGMNCLYFYPPAFIDEAARRGLADKDETMKRGKRFMVPFCIIMLVVLVLIIAVWNRVTTFTAAYWQAAPLCWRGASSNIPHKHQPPAALCSRRFLF